MPVVSNTSPVLNLAIIGQLAMLREQFAEIWVPPMVIEELRMDQNLPGSDAVRGAREARWLRVRAVQNRLLVQALERELDRGEAETIALALEMQAEWTLLDERDARRVAKALGLKVTGVLGILLAARRKSQLGSVRAAMEELRSKAGFHIGEELFSLLVKEDGSSAEF